MDRRLLLPLGLLGAWQLLDVAVHVATGQVEPLRIASNVIILVGAFAAARLAPPQADRMLFAAGGIYVALNVLFVAQYGLINPATDALRIPLIGFVLASLVLLTWQRARARG